MWTREGQLFVLRYCSLAAVFLLLASLPNHVNAQQVSVPAAFHRQEHTLSCEVATLKMALRTHGIEITEDELIAQLPFDRTPKRPGIWGDPNQGFVGNIDGRMLIDGYGVYWDPIAALGNKYAHTTVLQHSSPQQLARHIQAGSPVIIWGYYGERAVYGWQTPAGTSVRAMGGQHTRLVYGFDGTTQAPTRFYLIDPLSGHLTWSTQELMHNWSSLHHMGVAVAANPLWVRAPNETQVWELNAAEATRRWITSWDAFVRRGGSVAAVSSISLSELFTYAIGAPIN